MGSIKKNVKKRMPQNLEELQKFTIEEWNKIPEDYPKKLFKNYLKRIRKVIEIKGNRLEPFHLNAIRNEIEEEEQRRTNKYKEEKIKGKQRIKNKRILKMKKIYNDKCLNCLRNKEIRDLKRQKRGVTQKYKKLKVKNVRIRKREEKKEIDNKIKELKEMALIDYLYHLKEEKENRLSWNKRYHVKSEAELEEDEETVDTIGESISKILKLGEFISKNNVKYNLAFKKLEDTLEELKEERNTK